MLIGILFEELLEFITEFLLPFQTLNLVNNGFFNFGILYFDIYKKKIRSV